jgi:hypothetical protein
MYSEASVVAAGATTRFLYTRDEGVTIPSGAERKELARYPDHVLFKLREQPMLQRPDFLMHVTIDSDRLERLRSAGAGDGPAIHAASVRSTAAAIRVASSRRMARRASEVTLGRAGLGLMRTVVDSNRQTRWGVACGFTGPRRHSRDTGQGIYRLIGTWAAFSQALP